MNRILLASIVAFCALRGLAAEQKEIGSFKITTPRTVGMGNAYISMAKGFETLWTNPAGFDTPKKELSILAFNGTVPGNRPLMASLGTVDASSLSGLLSTLEPVVTGSGAGMNAGAGISWVGHRVGIGIFDSFDVYLQGDPFPAGVGGFMDNTASLIGGYAHPFPLTDSVTVSVGLALRPSLKWRSEDIGTLTSEALEADFDPLAYFNEKVPEPAFGVPVDLGVRAQLAHGLSAALTVRDIFATYSGGSAPYEYRTPWNLNAGAAWNPDMKSLKWLVDPTIAVEFSGLNRIITGDSGFWREFHLGVELVTLRKVLTFWAGIDGGHPAAGTSLDLFLLDLSVAFGTADHDNAPDTHPVSNLTVEVSFRID